MMPRVLLAWEGGAGRGHVSTLRTIAIALRDIAVCDAAVNNMLYAPELAPHCELVFPGSAFSIDLRRRTHGGHEAICSWADHLGDLGFGDVDFLISRLGWWIEAMRARLVRLVIADFAPLATLAARILGIASAVIGTGYLSPPPGMDRFPILVPRLSLAHHEEARLLDAVNAALTHYGAAPLTRFSDVYKCDVFLPQTIASLDPYAGQRQQAYLPPIDGQMPQAGDGTEIFGYFSTDECSDDALIEALHRLGPLLRLHMPCLSPHQASDLRQSGVKVQSGPSHLGEIASRSQLCLNAGQHGTLCMAMAMGMPQVAIPRHLEHAYHAERVQEMGCLRVVSRLERDPATIVAEIMLARGDAIMQSRARYVARFYRDQLCGPVTAILRTKLSPLLVR